ncbi:MAG: ABC transporter ATP-binding protein/permease [Actinomycetota bacterium]|nr:ABC transporter ATP-binding protein/permease [Actinomycetota bacterium]
MDSYCAGPTMAHDWGEDDRVRADWALVRRVLSYFRPHLTLGLAVVACIGVGAVLGLAPAVVFKELIDLLGSPEPRFGTLLALVAVAVGAAVAGGLVGVAESYLSTLISQSIVSRLRAQLFDRLVDQSVGFFTRTRAGDVLSRLNNDVGGVETVVADTAFGLVRNLLVTVAALALMLTFSWQLTLFILVLIPLVALPMRGAGKASYRARTRTQRKHAELTAYLQEMLGISGILLLKAFARGRYERSRFGRHNDELRDLEVRQAMISRWFAMVMQSIEVAGPALIMLLGGYLVITGQTTVGTVFVFATVLGSQLAGSITSLATMHVNVIGSLALFNRLFEYIDMAPEISDRPGARHLSRVRGAIQLDEVTFRYPGTERPALDRVSLDVEPGQLVALVGPSGAGKTTLTNLVPRFFDPQSGTMRIDGHDVRDVTLNSLGTHIGIVFQDTFLFHASLADNLRYAHPDATDEELAAAVAAAHLDGLVATLPEGYNTLVGERGHRLSGGEKQRVAIARVILKDPQILILDEATSNLDSLSEQLVQDALDRLFRGRTSLVIAHRLSTVLAADQICVLDRGRLVERGGHRDLLALGGVYAAQYQRQFRDEPDRSGIPAR